MQPLTLKQKLHELGNDIVIEVQVQNATPNNIFLESWKLEPIGALSATPLPSAAVVAATPSAPRVLAGDGIKQIAFRLQGRGERCAAAHFGPIARLDIAWRSGFGDRARLQTANFVVCRRGFLFLGGRFFVDTRTFVLAQHNAQSDDATTLELYIIDAPRSLPLEQEHEVQIEFVNLSEQRMLVRPFVFFKLAPLFSVSDLFVIERPSARD